MCLRVVRRDKLTFLYPKKILICHKEICGIVGWEDNIKMDIEEVGCRSMDWIELAQDRDRWRSLVNAVMNRRVP